MKLKIYYNSISRQSRILHNKEKLNEIYWIQLNEVVWNELIGGSAAQLFSFIPFHLSLRMRDEIENEMKRESIGGRRGRAGMEFTLGGLRALLRHGNQPKGKTSPARQQTSFFLHEIYEINGMNGKNGRRGEANNPSIKEERLVCSFFVVGYGRWPSTAEKFHSINNWIVDSTSFSLLSVCLCCNARKKTSEPTNSSFSFLFLSSLLLID